MREKPNGISMTCASCGAPFRAWPSEVKRGNRFCSNQCGADSRKKLVQRNCIHCGVAFSIRTSEFLIRRGAFCSIRCHFDYKMERSADRFWRSVQKSEDPDGCWLFLRSSDARGYGHFTYRSKNIPAHRFSFILAFGEPPADKPFVCHRCNNPPCVRPDHLYADNQAGNMAYKMACGRHPLGSRVVTSKLTEPAVASIKRQLLNGVHATVLAVEFRVSTDTIRLIARNKSWKHVQAAPA